MKIKAVESILKGEKTILLFGCRAGEQWLGASDALYPMYGMPLLSEELLYTIFDIDEKKQDKFYFEDRAELPWGIAPSDFDRAEAALERGSICIVARGRVLEPIKTSQGTVFINRKYLAPFADAENGVGLYERKTDEGRIYIAVKEGFCLVGILFPVDLIDEGFCDHLAELARLTRVAFDHKRALLKDEEQISFEEDEDE